MSGSSSARGRAASASSSVRSAGTEGFRTPPEDAPILGPMYSGVQQDAAPVVISSASIRTARSEQASIRTAREAGATELGDVSDVEASNGSVTAVKSTIAGSIFRREHDSAVLPTRSPLFYKWRQIVVVSLLAGYMGYYFNRSNLSVAQDEIIEKTGVTPTEMSLVLSIGYGVYAFGKMTTGIAVDYFGGRPLFLIGLFGSAVFTVLFTLFDDVAGFAAMWSVNRYLQSVGWGALVKLTSQWFDSHEYGRIMGIMSLSYMFGDAVIRIVFGLVLDAGFTWQELFYTAAAIGGAIGIVLIFTLKASPTSIGEPEPMSNSRNVYLKEGERDEAINHGSVLNLLLPLFRNPMFWVLMLMSMILTMIREMFNAWLPTYLKVVLKIDAADAAYASALFPAAGTISAILGGWLVDRVSSRWRAGVPIAFLMGLAVSLLSLWAFNRYESVLAAGAGGVRSGSEALALALVLVACVGLTLIAPYSFLDGIFIMNLSGKRGSASAASLVNASGYIGAIVSPYIVSLIVSEEQEGDATEWAPVFVLLACLTVVTAIANGFYWHLDLKDQDTPSPHDPSERQSLVSKNYE